MRQPFLNFGYWPKACSNPGSIYEGKKNSEILVRTVNSVAIQLTLFLVPVSQQCGNPENQQAIIAVNTSSLAASGGGGTGLELLQGPIPRELSLPWSGASKKTPFARLSLSDLIWSLPTANSLWAGGVAGRTFVKNNQRPLLSVMLPQEVANS